MEYALPEDLSESLKEIDVRFSKISDDWKKYDDQIIPQNEVLSSKILGFLVELCKFIEKNFAEIDETEFKEFLSTFHHRFNYGEFGDDHSYLEGEQQINGESLCDVLSEFDEFFTKKHIQSFRKELEKIISKFK